jgi:hypothetical protein
MARMLKTLDDPLVLQAALEGLTLQKQRIEEQMREIRTQLGRRPKPSPDAPPTTNGRKRNLSPEARKRIATAQKRRWAEYRKSNSSAK